MKLTESEHKNINLAIDILEDQIGDLELISVQFDDMFDVQLVSLKELVKDLRKQLL